MGVASSFARRNIRGCAPLMTVVALCMAAAPPALAGTTMPNPPPASSPVTFPQLPSPVGIQCNTQLDTAINAADYAGLLSEATGLATNVLAFGSAETAAQTSFGAFTDQALAFGVMEGFGLPSPGNSAGTLGATDGGLAAGVLAGAAEGSGLAYANALLGLASQATGVASQTTANTYRTAELGLPGCNNQYIGTQSIGVGVGNTALNVTSGESIFAGNVYVGKNGTDNGNVYASQFQATQGISADG
jgi:hypothetical protein